MINLDDLKPILQDVVSEDNMADTILRISEIDKDVDTSALDEANATIAKLQEQNKKLTDIFFNGKPEVLGDKSIQPPSSTGTDDEDEYESPTSYDDLFVVEE